MAVLTRPDLPAGAGRDLVEALHELHHRAGWPSLRSLAREVGCSPTTMSGVFSSPRLPTWGLLELVVEAMDGDTEMFRELWCAAGQAQPSSHETGVRVAGRRHELAALRRHMELGRGGRLLLLTGEAGIGKTRLVDAARGAVDEVFVASGSCLPLSTEVPLLPIAELLRGIFDRDEGQSLKEAFADCPPYVPAAISPLLPEVEALAGVTPAPGGDWERQHLLTGLRATLTALGSQRGFAAVVEDLHWADSATLDLLDFVTASPGGPGLPMVGSYRTEDPATPPATKEWLLRIKGSPVVDLLELEPLTRAGTAEQLELLGHRVAPEGTDRIHARSGGHPLFTEQLAAELMDGRDAEDGLPRRLTELLDRRLTGISEDSWRVARALGVADRELTRPQLRQVTGLSDDALSARLHELDDRRLLAVTEGHDVRVRHPLLAEAIRLRLMPGEATDQHRRLARALADSPSPSAAEVAEHWRRAGAPGEELEWRIRAARSAEERFALAQAADQWRRVLALWPARAETAGAPAISRNAAYLAAMDCLMYIDVAAAWEIAEEAMSALTDPSSVEAAETYQRAADCQGLLGDPEGALALLERAVRIFETSPACEGHARALARCERFESALGREEQAAASAAHATQVAGELGDPAVYRATLIIQAMHDGVAGDLHLALSRAQEAASIVPAEPDPLGEVLLAANHTLILGLAGASAEDVAAAGRRGLEAADTCGLDTFPVSILRVNVAMALRHEGQVRRAAELIDPVTRDAPSQDLLFVHYERAHLDVLRGRLDAAAQRIEALTGFPIASLGNRIDVTEQAATVAMWCGRPEAALHRSLAVLEDCVDTDATHWTGRLMVLAAGSAADFVESSPDRAGRRSLLVRLKDLESRSARNPFEPHPAFSERPALAKNWQAELARLSGDDSVARWAAATHVWDQLTRPHDASYCRWRAAQAALRDGETGMASRLLRAATRDAREHAPLLAAIGETRASIGA